MWYLRDTPPAMGPTQLLRGSHDPGLKQWTDAEVDDSLEGAAALVMSPAGSGTVPAG